MDEMYGIMLSFIVFFGTIKFIQLLRFNIRFNQLMRTLSGCWDELTGFLLVFFVIFFAFVQLFYIILHNWLQEFSSVLASLETCFTILLGKFDFSNIRNASMTAAIMFFFFAISCSFILINVMLTIIIETYEEVRLVRTFQIII
jgi:hypothetical protein